MDKHSGGKAASTEGIGPLPPQRDGQAHTITRTMCGIGDDCDMELGHWFSPHAVQARIDAAVAAERERWKCIADAAQTVTTGCDDKIGHFEVPSHLMAALALALDDGPNAEVMRPSGGRGE